MSLLRIIERTRHDRLGEGLLWSARETAVYWTDILGQRLHRLKLDDDAIASWDMPETIGWVVERRAAPGFLAGFASGIVALTLDPVTVTPLLAPEPDLPGNRMNDALVDAHGRLWAGTMSFDGGVPTGALYRFDPDHRLTLIDAGYRVTNGPTISPDGRWLYHADSPLGLVYRFPLDARGDAGPRATFLRFEADWGSPDGMTIDAEGGLWIAHWGGGRISRFTPDGQLDRSIALPASQVTNIVFAGPNLDRMFVTSAAAGVKEPHAGALFEVAPGVRGCPTHLFAG